MWCHLAVTAAHVVMSFGRDAGVAPPTARRTSRSATQIALRGGLPSLIVAIAGCHYGGYLPTEPALPVYGVQELGLLAGGTESAANGASAAAIVGWATDAGGVTHAVAFTAGAAMRLVEPTGALSSQAAAVNNSGVAVGFATTARGATQALVWQSLTSAPTPLPSLGGAYAAAVSINDQNVILGVAQTDSGDTVLVEWRPGAATYAVMRIDSAGGPDGEAVAINDDGQVAGTFDGGAAAFFWDPAVGVDTITPTSGTIAAEGLSNLGVEVGRIATAGGPTQAFVFTGTQGLDVMGAPPSGYTNVVANGVSDQGIVAGTASAVSGGGVRSSAVVIGTIVNPTGPFAALPSLGGTLAEAATNGVTSCGIIVGWATPPSSPARRAVAWTPNGCTTP